MTLGEFFAGQEASGAVFEPCPELSTLSGQWSFPSLRARSPFAHEEPLPGHGMPAQYLRGKHGPPVLSASLGLGEDASPRWKEIIEPVPKRLTHHLELYSAADVDGEVAVWLQEAWEAAG